MNHTISALISFFLIVFIIACEKNKLRSNINKQHEEKVDKFLWKNYRGANIGCEISEIDVKEFAKSGGNLLRYSSPVCTYIELEEPYSYNEMAFSKLDSVITWGEKYKVDILIDPHRYPGTEHKWTMLGSDPFWKDYKYHDILIKFWVRLARQCAEKGRVVAGYDLLNEPQIDIRMEENSPEDLSLLYKKLTEAIRSVDSVHTIVYALPRIYDEAQKIMLSYDKGINKIVIPDDDNICLETHTYMPVPFTHQNIWEPGEFISYPDTIEGEYWDRTKLENYQKELIDYSIENPDVPILVGEFSAPRWTGQDGLRYLTDVIEIAEKYNWSWSYHAFRENQVWDPEMSIEDRNDSTRIENAPRWELLKKYFKKNHVLK